MHDILERVAQDDIKLHFGYLESNFMSQSELISRIYAYDYGYLEHKNHPTLVKLDQKGNSVSQLNSILTQFRHRQNIPLVFGDQWKQTLAFASSLISNCEPFIFPLSLWRHDCISGVFDNWTSQIVHKTVSTHKT